MVRERRLSRSGPVIDHQAIIIKIARRLPDRRYPPDRDDNDHVRAGDNGSVTKDVTWDKGSETQLTREPGR